MMTIADLTEGDRFAFGSDVYVLTCAPLDGVPDSGVAELAGKKMRVHGGPRAGSYTIRVPVSSWDVVEAIEAS